MSAGALNRLTEAAGSTESGDSNNRRRQTAPTSAPSRRAGRVPLNFSIESIMQPNYNQQQQQQSHQVNSMLNNHYSIIKQESSPPHSRSRSRSRSPASSNRSSPASSDRSVDGLSCASGSGQFGLTLHQHQHRPMSHESSTRSDASTPISPGGGLPCDVDDSAEDDDDEDDDCCNTSESLRLNESSLTNRGNTAGSTRTNSRGSKSSRHQEVSSRLIEADNQIRMQQQQEQKHRPACQQQQNQLNRPSRHLNAPLAQPPPPLQQQQQPPAPPSSARQVNVMSPSSSSSHLSQVECVLDNKDMWDKFHSLNTEMIITKTGRRMFPVIKVQFHNLDPNMRYAVSMDIVPVDNKRYRYAYHKSCWQVAGKADPSAPTFQYAHPDSPFNGDLLSRQVVSFEKVKLTNNEMDKAGHIILNSMHKYQPRVHIFELKTTNTGTSTTTSGGSSNNQHHHHHHHQTSPLSQQQQSSSSRPSTSNQRYNGTTTTCGQHQQQKAPVPNLEIGDYRTYVFPETVFTAVTAYQNQLITKMKIDKNPFAKGFRDSSRLSDLDRNDPFDYMSSLGPAAACAAAAAAAAAAASGRGFGPPSGPGSMCGGGPLGSSVLAGGLGHGGPPTPHSGGHMSSPIDQAHMDQAYAQLFAAANNPWYAAAAAASQASSNPFGPLVSGLPPSATTPTSGGPTSSGHSSTSVTAVAAAQHQMQATQMWLAALACLNGGGAGVGGMAGQAALGAAGGAPPPSQTSSGAP